MAQQTQAVERKSTNEETFKVLLKKYENQIKSALPDHVTPERMLRVIKTAVSLSPKLMDCSPLSVIAAIVQASQYGLDIGMMNQAFIVPRWNGKTQRQEACFQMGYGGCIELAMRTGKIKMIQPRLVMKQDKFFIRYKPDLEFQHEIPGSTNSRRNPDDIIGAYLATTFVTGAVQIDWLPKEDIDHIRDTYGPRDRNKNLVGPWLEEYAQMALKSVVHSGTKWIPKSTELGMALQKESRVDSGEAPEFVVLDISPAEADNAQMQAVGESATKVLKEKLAQAQSKPARAHEAATGGEPPEGDTKTPPPGTSNGPATAAEGGESPSRPPVQADVSGEGQPEGKGAAKTAPDFTKLPVLDRLPHPASSVEEDYCNVQGRVYQFLKGSWMFYGPATTATKPAAEEPAADKLKFGEKPPAAKKGKGSDAGDFT